MPENYNFILATTSANIKTTEQGSLPYRCGEISRFIPIVDVPKDGILIRLLSSLTARSM